MAIFSISDIVIAATLIINALALMSTKIKQYSLDHRNKTRLNMSISNMNINIESLENYNTYSDYIMINRLVHLVVTLRRLSSLIILWNIFFFFLMIGVFGS